MREQGEGVSARDRDRAGGPVGIFWILDCRFSIVEGDLLRQDVEAIVNPWNRNTIPWWLLLPQGVSGAIKRRAGTAPFRELARHGRLRLGQAVATGAGRLPFKAIIHVAGINDLWRASEQSIRDSVENAMRLAEEMCFSSIAMPLIGAGSGGFDKVKSLAVMERTLAGLSSSVEVRVVVFTASERGHPTDPSEVGASHDELSL